MPSKPERFRIAVLDDYQNVALSLAGWSVLDEWATVTVFSDHLADSDAVIERFQPFDIVCVMRERTPMTGEQSLPTCSEIRQSTVAQRRPESMDIVL